MYMFIHLADPLSRVSSIRFDILRVSMGNEILYQARPVSADRALIIAALPSPSNLMIFFLISFIYFKLR